MQVALTRLLDSMGDGRRESRNDPGEDQDRDTVTDTAFSDLFAEPHQEHSPCDQTYNSGEIERKAWINHQALHTRHIRQTGSNTDRLEYRQHQSTVAGVLADLTTTRLPFFLQLCQRLVNHRQQLHDDRCRDIRHNPQCKDRSTAESTTREHVEHFNDGASLLLKQFGKYSGINTRDRNKRANTEHYQRTDHKQKSAFQFAKATFGTLKI